MPVRWWQELDAVFATRDMPEWRRILDAVGVTFGVVGKVDDVAHDEQMRAIGALVPFADGEALTVSSPFHLDGEAKVAPRRAPALGQHSEAVLREAGYGADEIGRLRKLGVLAWRIVPGAAMAPGHFHAQPHATE